VSRWIAPALCSLLVVATSACFRYQTRVPGVLDMRTDASAAKVAPAEAPLGPNNRRGIKGLAIGRGVNVAPEGVRVEVRRWWLHGGLLLTGDASSEVRAATEISGALRDVVIRERQAPLDVLFSLVGRNVPLGVWIIPPYSFEATGVPVVPPRAAGRARPLLPARPPNPLDDLPPPPMPIDEADEGPPPGDAGEGDGAAPRPPVDPADGASP
jgi:hypothetical protein